MEHTPEEVSGILASADVERKSAIIEKIRRDADAGDPRANYMLAKWYLSGAFGFKKNKKAFESHIKIALNRLLPEAVYDYGVVIERRQKDYRKAFGYYVLAAILGDVDAVDAVMKYFIYGDVVERDDFIASSLQMRKDYLKSEATENPETGE